MVNKFANVPTLTTRMQYNVTKYFTSFWKRKSILRIYNVFYPMYQSKKEEHKEYTFISVGSVDYAYKRNILISNFNSARHPFKLDWLVSSFLYKRFNLDLVA